MTRKRWSKSRVNGDYISDRLGYKRLIYLVDTNVDDAACVSTGLRHNFGFDIIQRNFISMLWAHYHG